jgi:hypothetical protein
MLCMTLTIQIIQNHISEMFRAHFVWKQAKCGRRLVSFWMYFTYSFHICISQIYFTDLFHNARPTFHNPQITIHYSLHSHRSISHIYFTDSFHIFISHIHFTYSFHRFITHINFTNAFHIFISQIYFTYSCHRCISHIYSTY